VKEKGRVCVCLEKGERMVCGFVVAMTARQAAGGQGEGRERYREEKKGRKSHAEAMRGRKGRIRTDDRRN